MRMKDTHSFSRRDTYHRLCRPEPMIAAVQGLARAYSKRLEYVGALSEEMQSLKSRLVQRVEDVGQGYQIIGSSLEEECEREVEKEVAQEEEAEREVPKMAPCSETDWDYDGLVAGRVARAAAVPSSKALGAVVAEIFHQRAGISSIPWSRAVYCTANFVETVKQCNGAAVATKEDYLRLVRSLLVFEGEGGILLLSEREADGILSRLHHRRATAAAEVGLPFHLVDMAYARLALTDPKRYKAMGSTALSHRLPALLSAHVHDFISVQLFGGDTAFPTKEQEAGLRRLLSNEELHSSRSGLTSKAALSMPRFRGLELSIQRSDLEKVVMSI